MTGKRVGYIRVSSVLQNTERQLDGVELDRVFEEKLSGKDRDRPKLAEMIAYVRDGDIVLVHSLDRLGRNMRDLLEIVDELNKKSVTIQFIKEKLTFEPGDSSPFARFQLQIFAAVAEFERAMIRERQKEGIAIARTKNRYMGSKRILTDEQVRLLLDRVETGEPLARVARDLGSLGLKYATGKERTSIHRATLIEEREAYVNKYPEIVKVYPRLTRYLRRVTA